MKNGTEYQVSEMTTYILFLWFDTIIVSRDLASVILAHRTSILCKILLADAPLPKVRFIDTTFSNILHGSF